MTNLLDPSILFFIFGLFAGLVKSNLEIPQPISRFLSLYLLMALGLKGGFALNKSGFTPEILISLGLAISLAILIPVLSYKVLKLHLNLKLAGLVFLMKRHCHIKLIDLRAHMLVLCCLTWSILMCVCVCEN